MYQISDFSFCCFRGWCPGGALRSLRGRFSHLRRHQHWLLHRRTRPACTGGRRLALEPLGADVPSKVAAAYDEAVRALSARAPNASVAMCRTAISYIVEDHGSPQAQAKTDLKGKIKEMVNDGGPMAALGDWATHVRFYGNAGAHPDLFGDVSVDEAQEVVRLVYTMIEVLYVLPANIAKRQAERRP